MAAQWLAWRLKLPSILLLLLAGFLVGPITGWLHPQDLLGELLHPLISLAVGVILFEGGLTLKLAELGKIGTIVLRLCTLGVLATWALAAGLLHFLVLFSWPLALLFGAVLTVTGPTVIGPLLRHVRPHGRVGPVANWEGIVADVIGATLAVLTFHAILDADVAQVGLGPTLWGLAKTVLVGSAAGGLGAWILSVPLRRYWIPDNLQSPWSLGLVLAVFVASDRMQHESGLLAVTLMGFLMANQKGASIQHIIEFKENLRTLLLSSLFVVLAASLRLESLTELSWREFAFVGLLIVLVRPVAVGLALVGSSATRAERSFLAWLAPRGVVAAAITALFAGRLADAQLMGERVMPEAARLVPLSFLVIVATVTVYGLTAAPLARRLQLASANPQGVLIVGGSLFAQAVAKALGELKLAVVLMDTNHQTVAKARLAGIQAIYGSALAADAVEHIPLGGLGRMMAMTSNDEVNSLATLHFAELFGRAETYQLSPSGISAKRETSSNLHGRYLFQDTARFEDLERRLAQGHRLATTQLTEAFSFAEFLAHHGDDALPLFRYTPDGRLIVSVQGSPPNPQPGDKLISLLGPEPKDASAKAPAT
ncbi:MAG: cation:proton antiporter [Planctomycetes bacterium]|nr:cation:proton antiporter [Planctomycetota bacterium]